MIGRRATLLISAALLCIGSIVVSVSQSFPVLLLGRALQGFGSGCSWCACSVYITEIAPPRYRGALVSISVSKHDHHKHVQCKLMGGSPFHSLVQSTPVHSGSLQPTPLHSTPLHSTSLYSTPLHSTAALLHCCTADAALPHCRTAALPHCCTASLR